MSRKAAARLAAQVGADIPPPPPAAKRRRVSLDERLTIAGWMPRYRAGIGHDYWQAASDGRSAGVADSHAAARQLAIARLESSLSRKEQAWQPQKSR